MGIITCIDISIAIILIGSVIFGYMTGLVMKIAHFIALIASYIIAEVATKFVPLQMARPIVFPVVFLIALVILRQLVNVLKIVDHIPVAGTLNRIGGAVAGLVLNVIIIYILLSIFFVIVPQEFLDSLGLTKNAIENSILLQAFY